MGVKLMDLRGEKLQAVAPVVSSAQEEAETEQPATPET
jgi:hypothetical protein